MGPPPAQGKALQAEMPRVAQTERALGCLSSSAEHADVIQKGGRMVNQRREV